MFVLGGHQHIKCYVCSILLYVPNTHLAVTIGCALSFKDPVDLYTALNLCSHELNSNKWKALNYVKSWLQSFWEATVQMSTTKKSMLSSTHAVFMGLQEEIKEIIKGLPQDVDPALKKGLVEAHWKLSDYFTKFDQSDYYHWAACMWIFTSWMVDLSIFTVLDPCISYGSLVQDYKDDPDLQDDMELAKNRLEMHFNIWYNTSTAVADVTSTSADNQRSPRKDFAAHYAKKQASPAERNELREYFRLTHEPADFKTTDALEWWHTHRETFPNLYHLAWDILCIPGMFIHFHLYISNLHLPRFSCCCQTSFLWWSRPYWASACKSECGHH